MKKVAFLLDSKLSTVLIRLEGQKHPLITIIFIMTFFQLGVFYIGIYMTFNSKLKDRDVHA